MKFVCMKQVLDLKVVEVIKDMIRKSKLTVCIDCMCVYTLQETNMSPTNALLKMIFLFPRWDMLIPWRVYTSIYTHICVCVCV